MWWNAYFKDKVGDNLQPLQPFSNLSPTFLQPSSKLAKFVTEFREIGNYPQIFSQLAKFITEFEEIADYLQPSSNLSPNSLNSAKGKKQVRNSKNWNWLHYSN